MKGVAGFSNDGPFATLDASGLHYRELNARLRSLVEAGATYIKLYNVAGQRYIGTDLDRPVKLEIFGTPGNDLGAFMDGPEIIVHGNAQDGCGNTMNNGVIIVHGLAGDITGLSARGGKIFVRDDVGYRAAIHMKQYGDKRPILVVGGTAQDFLGEYMAGGVAIILGLTLGKGERHRANFIGTGMHGGVIFLRGRVEEYQLGKEVGVVEPDERDRELLKSVIFEFCSHFSFDPEEVLSEPFIKLFPLYLRPYGPLYAPTHRGAQGPVRRSRL
jgi:glutamate synthase domain-containing protein 3